MKQLKKMSKYIQIFEREEKTYYSKLQEIQKEGNIHRPRTWPAISLLDY